MTKNDVLKFLDTASPEMFSEIRAYMTKIRQDREFAEFLEKKKQKQDRTEKMYAYRLQGKTYKDIAEIFELSAGRCQQICKRHERRLQRQKQA